MSLPLFYFLSSFAFPLGFVWLKVDGLSRRNLVAFGLFAGLLLLLLGWKSGLIVSVGLLCLGLALTEIQHRLSLNLMHVVGLWAGLHLWPFAFLASPWLLLAWPPTFFGLADWAPFLEGPLYETWGSAEPIPAYLSSLALGLWGCVGALRFFRS